MGVSGGEARARDSAGRGIRGTGNENGVDVLFPAPPTSPGDIGGADGGGLMCPVDVGEVGGAVCSSISRMVA
jgi:hypothetical protein